MEFGQSPTLSAPVPKPPATGGRPQTAGAGGGVGVWEAGRLEASGLAAWGKSGWGSADCGAPVASGLRPVGPSRWEAADGVWPSDEVARCGWRRHGRFKLTRTEEETEAGSGGSRPSGPVLLCATSSGGAGPSKFKSGFFMGCTCSGVQI